MSDTPAITIAWARLALHVDELTIEYDQGGEMIRPVDRLSFSAAPGSLTVLLGPSGSGKTSVLVALAGLCPPTNGAVTVAEYGAPRPILRHEVGVVFQSFNLIPSLTAVDNVAIPLRAAGWSRHTARRQATALLTELGLDHRLRHRPATMSGGEQQRVAIARALALDPPVLIADEPTAHLDRASADATVAMLRHLADRDRTLVVATHDERFLAVADQVVAMGGPNAAAVRSSARTAPAAARR